MIDLRCWAMAMSLTRVIAFVGQGATADGSLDHIREEQMQTVTPLAYSGRFWVAIQEQMNLAAFWRRMLKRVRSWRDVAVVAIRGWRRSAKKRLLRHGYSRFWRASYGRWYQLTYLIAGHGATATLTALVILIGVTAYWLPALQVELEPYSATAEQLGRFRTLILTVGGALIGATAITFSLIMFAMQVNVERVPHGLFRKLSADRRLLSAFAATFGLAIAIATLSVVAETSWIALAVLGSGWATVLILVLFLYAYRRALVLINPGQQLQIVVNTARKDLQRWARRADHATALFEQPNTDNESALRTFQSTHDLARVAYFELNPNWTNEARRAVAHAISFARRYAEYGDHEVSGAALSAVVRINAAYMEAKGKTFFAQQLLLDSPRATDGFINDTLEDLRQNLRISITRGDERNIEQTLQALALLVRLYLNIDYSYPLASKTHAFLAAGYLSNAAESIVPHKFPDVLMEWMRLMGESAQGFIVHEQPNDIVPLAEKVSLVAATCMAIEDYRPVTLAGVQQLARLVLTLIRSTRIDPDFALGKLTSDVTLVARAALAVPDTPFGSIHHYYLAPYYSATSTDTLLEWLTNLANALVERPEKDKDARQVIRNVERWAEDLHRSEKDVLLLAMENRSHFTFDIIHWIAHVTKLLLTISNAPTCDTHTCAEIRNHATSLVYVLNSIPDNGDVIAFVENFQMTETLFDLALDAHRRDCLEASQALEKILVSWAFKAGRYHTGWDVLERSMCALATLAIVRGGGLLIQKLKDMISERLSGKNPPDQERRDWAARELRRKAVTGYRREYSVSHIERAMSQIDRELLAPALNEIADTLSPGTRDEPVETGYF